MNSDYEVRIYNSDTRKLTIPTSITNAKTIFSSNITLPTTSSALLTIRYLTFPTIGNIYSKCFFIKLTIHNNIFIMTKSL